jgi:hypothetical protein
MAEATDRQALLSTAKENPVEPTNVLPIAAVLSLVTVEYGGWALLTFISGREGLADWQKGFFRAGHAHAGVLLVLSLVYLLYLPRTDFSDALEWVAGGVLLAGVLAQSGGFFVHLGVGQEGKPSAGTKLTPTRRHLTRVARSPPAMRPSRCFARWST